MLKKVTRKLLKKSIESLFFKQMQTETSALLSTLDLFERYSVFCEKMAKTDDTWKFWDLFTDKVMLPYVMLWYGIRFSNWELRVAEIKLIAPISHALDRTSYLRILPRHIADIYCLPAPILNHFKSGGFVVNLSGKAFSSVAFDESHEMLINKDIKAAIRRIEPDYIQRICPYLPIRAKVIKTIKSQMNLSRACAVNPNIMNLSKQDVNFESNVRAIYNIVKNVNLLLLQ